MKNGATPNVEHGLTEYQIEQWIGRLLQIGVVIATVIVLCGGSMVLLRHGGTFPDYRVFRGASMTVRSVGSIVHAVRSANPEALVQFGIVLLIATPVIRVAFMLVAFAVQRDRLYVLLSTIVLLLLLFGLFGNT